MGTPYFRDWILPRYAIYVKSLDLSELHHDTGAVSVELLIKYLPVLRNVVHLAVGFFCANARDRRRQLVFKHLVKRAKRIDSLEVNTVGQAQALLRGANRLVELELAGALSGDQPQALWQLLESLPGLKRFDYNYLSGSRASVGDLVPNKHYSLPSIQHLALRTDDDSSDLYLCRILQSLIGIFAPDLVTLELSLDGTRLYEDKAPAEWTLPKGGLLPKLRTLEIAAPVQFTKNILAHWQDPAAATSLRRITLTPHDLAAAETNLPSLLLSSLSMRCPQIEVISVYPIQYLIEEISRYYAGAPGRIRLAPRLYPSTVLAAFHSTDESYNLMRLPSLPPSASTAQPPLELEPELRGCEQIVEGIDETLEFLAQWRDRAILQADPVALVRLAEALKHADVARVRHLA
ncbi:hypothetical protein JCM10908_002231 [Rhodotorula pacifica]|uniref:uncharacterized protein n=1 Tax=Rhodotorula pacifica TaxID=1495444 RepID=UPI003173F15A